MGLLGPVINLEIAFVLSIPSCFELEYRFIVIKKRAIKIGISKWHVFPQFLKRKFKAKQSLKSVPVAVEAS